FLYPAAYALMPGLQFFRDHERAALVTSFAAAVLAGQGLGGLLAGTRLALPPLPRGVALGPIVLGVAMVLFGLLAEYALIGAPREQKNPLGALGDRAFLTALFAFLAAGWML